VDSRLGLEEVAAWFGVSPLFVRQRLKLANFSPPLIEAYRVGEMQLEQLEALAITDGLSVDLLIYACVSVGKTARRVLNPLATNY
jgi:hypothetical protein